MGWELFLLKTPTNTERDLSQVTEAAPMPCWEELRTLLYERCPELREGYAVLEEQASFPVWSAPAQGPDRGRDYALEFNLGTDDPREPLTGILFNRPGGGRRWLYPLKLLCTLLDARIVDCGGGDFWDWDHLPDPGWTIPDRIEGEDTDET